MSDTETTDVPETADAPAKPATPVAQVVERYIALRDKLAQMKADYDAKTADIKTAMDRCEAFLLTQMTELGADSFKTPVGTAYKTTKTSATVADWDATLNFIRNGEHWAMLDKRVSKSFVDAYRNEHNDLPPGINWREEVAVNIRRS